MNKKISAVTLSAIMVLTIFSALVPAASAVEEVSAPYEFIAAVEKYDANKNATFALNSSKNPSVLYFDFDDGEGKETLDFTINATTKLLASTLKYTTTIYPGDKDSAWDKIAWLGQPYAVVDNTSGDIYLSKILVDEGDDESHLLRVGESLTLPEGFAVTPLEIDVDGGEAWFSVTKDGEEVDSTVTKEEGVFKYEADLNESNDEDNTVLQFNVETVFAGMNTNLVKINNTQLISTNVVKVENADTDLITDYEISISADKRTITIEPDDKTDDISLTKGGTRGIMDKRFLIRINDDGTYVAVVKEITEPGLYELFADVQKYDANNNATFALNSSKNPSVLYFDFDEGDGNETLDFTINATTKLLASTLKYTTTIYPGDKDSAWNKIAWLGQSYAVVDNTSGDIYLSKILVDEGKDETHLLRVGESLTLPEGFAVTPLEIDVDGGEAWFSVTKDGEEVDSTVTKEEGVFKYEADLNESNDEDNTVLQFNVETVFAGMNTNLVKINNTQLISTNVVKVENADTDLITDYEISISSNGQTITIEPDDKTDDISLTKGGTRGIMDNRFLIRINDDGTHVAVVKEVQVGGEVTPTPTPTEEATEEPTVEATETEVGGAEGTATAEATETVVEEEPTPEPTKEKEPGFEAVFAIAGLLAVAYLVLRQRD